MVTHGRVSEGQQTAASPPPSLNIWTLMTPEKRNRAQGERRGCALCSCAMSEWTHSLVSSLKWMIFMDTLDTINLIMNDNTDNTPAQVLGLQSHIHRVNITFIRATAWSNKMKDYKQRRKYDHDLCLCSLLDLL